VCDKNKQVKFVFFFKEKVNADSNYENKDLVFDLTVKVFLNG